MRFLKFSHQKINFFFRFLLTFLKKYYIILFQRKKENFKKEEIMADKTAHEKKNGNGNGNEHGNKSKGRTSYNIPIEKIMIRPGFNPRMDFNKGKLEELKGDIQDVGILTDLLIQPRSEEKGTFWLVDGERRLICAKELKFERVPCNILPAAFTELDLIRYAYSTMRVSTLNEIEEGALFYRLISNFGKTVADISTSFKVSIGTVNNRLKVYEEAPADKIEALRRGELKFTNVLKEVREGESAIKTVDPEKVERKKWEKETKSHISQFVKWLWAAAMEGMKSDAEKKEMETLHIHYVNYLVEKYEKFQVEKGEAEEEEEVKTAKKRGRPSKNQNQEVEEQEHVDDIEEEEEMNIENEDEIINDEDVDEKEKEEEEELEDGDEEINLDDLDDLEVDDIDFEKDL